MLCYVAFTWQYYSEKACGIGSNLNTMHFHIPISCGWWQISFCRNSESEQDSICHAVIDEIRMMATLNHPNIVRILGATQTGAHFNMFVEWMPGGSVTHLLEKYGAFSEPVITSYTQQVLMGLAYLQDRKSVV